MSKKKDKNHGISISFVDDVASEQVTGSLIYIKTNSHNLIIEAGLSQTNNLKNDYLTNNRKFKEFKPKNIDIVFALHNHADHILGIPRLFRDGCEGAVVTPVGSKMIQEIMYADCIHINERDCELLNLQNGS